MFAASASTIAPAAGCSGGTSGNSQRSSGRSARPTSETRPAASATRIIPSQRVMIADEADRDLDRGGRRFHGALRDRVGGAVESRHDERDRHQAEPDVVEHAGMVA